MPRLDLQPFVELPSAERKLIEAAKEDDWFLYEGWERYGPDWTKHVPTAIQVAVRYYFDTLLLAHQLQYYYCPIRDICIHGGRYSAKTFLAVVNALFVALHPGNNWLHVSPSLDQAKLSYNVVLEKGKAGKFYERFVGHTRTAPSPEIFFKRWDEHDPGSVAQFRSVGQQPAELLRGLEAGIITADEPFRTQLSDAPYRVLAGSARGPNDYILNQNPDLKRQYEEMAFAYSMELDIGRRQERQDEIEEFVRRHNLDKYTRIALYGNVGSWHWEWQRFEYGLKHPDERWSTTWWSEMNPWVSRRQRRLIEQQFMHDPQGLRVEMRAEKPVAIGQVFPELKDFFESQLEEEAIKMVAQGEPGWVYDTHESFGLIHYEKPPEKGAVYAFGSDPGTGQLPRRDKYVIIGARIDQRPFEIVYIKTGVLSPRQKGDINHWINAVKNVVRRYPMPHDHFAAEAGGPQKNVHHVIWPDDLVITPLNMNSIKATLVMEAQLMIGRHMFLSPNCGLFESELLSYELQDRKLDQDFVMAFLALVSVLWDYVAHEFVIEEDDEEVEQWDTIPIGREVRMPGREVRIR